MNRLPRNERGVIRREKGAGGRNLFGQAQSANRNAHGASVGRPRKSIGLTRRPGDAVATGTASLSAEEADRERYNLYWGLTAGVNMPLASNLNLSLAYRYVGQGENDRATLDREAGDPDSGLHSHDLMLIFGVSF